MSSQPITSTSDLRITLLRSRPAVHQLCIGSWLQTAFDLGDDVRAIPLRAMGFSSEVHYLAQYAKEVVGAQVDASAVRDLLVQTEESQPVVSLFLPLAVDAPPEDLDTSASARLEQARRVLSWVSGRDVTAVGMVIATLDKVFFRPLPPPHKSRQFLFGVGGSWEDFQSTILRIASRMRTDERFAFALSLYHDALKEPNGQFRIGRMFNVLECLAATLKSAQTPSRKAVKKMLGLTDGAFVDMQLPEGGYRFDCVEIAGRIRDKLFHGTPFRESDLDVQSRHVFPILAQYADEIAGMVAGYCELELNRWANGTSIGQASSDPHDSP